jgi:hypothetical protein
MTQTQWTLARLKRGPLTPLDALAENGCMRLAARIAELRAQGYNITTENRTVNGKTFAVYRLMEKRNEAVAA